MTDIEVVEKIQKGDETALHFLYKKYYRMMVNLVIKNNGTEDEAKDIFQDSLVVFWQKVTSKELVLTSKISTYLYSICQNLWRKELERKSRLVHESRDRAVLPDDDRQERIKLVGQALNALGEGCKKILTYYYFEDRSMQDIADLMGFANADTAKTKKYKCKKELDNILKSRYKTHDFLD
jgi:RNA polymerase sigma factor (sigma-70 family)